MMFTEEEKELEQKLSAPKPGTFCAACKIPRKNNKALFPNANFHIHLLGHPQVDNKSKQPHIYGPWEQRPGGVDEIKTAKEGERICNDCYAAVRKPSTGGPPIAPLDLCAARVAYINELSDGSTELGKTRRGEPPPPKPWSIWDTDRGTWVSEWTSETRPAHGPVIRLQGRNPEVADFMTPAMKPDWWKDTQCITKEAGAPSTAAPGALPPTAAAAAPIPAPGAPKKAAKNVPMGFDTVSNSGAGDCLPLSVARALTELCGPKKITNYSGDEQNVPVITHAQVRSLARNSIVHKVENWNGYAVDMSNKIDVAGRADPDYDFTATERHMDAEKRVKSWAGRFGQAGAYLAELHLRELVECLGRDIIIYEAGGDPGGTRLPVGDGDMKPALPVHPSAEIKPGEPIRLYRIPSDNPANEHYEAVLPNPGTPKPAADKSAAPPEQQGDDDDEQAAAHAVDVMSVELYRQEQQLGTEQQEEEAPQGSDEEDDDMQEDQQEEEAPRGSDEEDDDMQEDQQEEDDDMQEEQGDGDGSDERKSSLQKDLEKHRDQELYYTTSGSESESESESEYVSESESESVSESVSESESGSQSQSDALAQHPESDAESDSDAVQNGAATQNLGVPLGEPLGDQPPQSSDGGEDEDETSEVSESEEEEHAQEQQEYQEEHAQVEEEHAHEEEEELPLQYIESWEAFEDYHAACSAQTELTELLRKGVVTSEAITSTEMVLEAHLAAAQERYDRAKQSFAGMDDSMLERGEKWAAKKKLCAILDLAESREKSKRSGDEAKRAKDDLMRAVGLLWRSGRLQCT